MKSTAQLVRARAAIFIGLTALSVPLAFPVGMALLVPLQQFLFSPWPDGQFWHLLDDLVFDMPLKWPFVVLGPGYGISADGPYFAAYTIPSALVFWSAVGILYGWLTRRIRLLYVALGVLPTVWAIGIIVVSARGI